MTDGDTITLREAGMALYGLEWKAPLARDLNVDVRTMRRWANGEFTIPDAVWSEIGKLCQSFSTEYSIRSKTLKQLARDLSDEE